VARSDLRAWIVGVDAAQVVERHAEPVGARQADAIDGLVGVIEGG
jgi:hypothetical protein